MVSKKVSDKVSDMTNQAECDFIPAKAQRKPQIPRPTPTHPPRINPHEHEKSDEKMKYAFAVCTYCLFGNVVV